MRNVSWKRVLFLVSIIVIICAIPASLNLSKLAQPAPHKTILDNPPFKEVNIPLSGKVYFPDGKPAPDTNIYLFEEGRKGGKGLISNMKTDTTGFWIFHKVYYEVATDTADLKKNYPNDYMVIATHSGYGFDGFYFRSTTSMDTASIFLNPEHHYSGKVTDELGQPLNGVNLYLFSIHGFVFNYSLNEKYSGFDWLVTTTNENGEFTYIGLPEFKSAVIFATLDGYGFQSTRSFSGNKEAEIVLEKMFKPNIKVISQENQKPLPNVLIKIDYNDFKTDSEGIAFIPFWLRKGNHWTHLDNPRLVSDEIKFELNRQNPSPEIILYARDTSQ
jgi:hypothetical protein